MAADEDWVASEKYLHAMFELEPRGWKVAKSETGEIIGMRVLQLLSPETAAGGMYIVQKHLRGQGIGREVNAACMDVVGDRNVVIAAIDVTLYNRKGFTSWFEFEARRGTIGDLLRVLPPQKDVRIHQYDQSLFEELKNYDTEVCGEERPNFLQKWIIHSAHRLVISRSEHGNISGYGSVRHCEYGWELAPLYADSEEEAWELIRALLGDLGNNEPVITYLKTDNSTLANLTRKCNMSSMDHVTKMYLKPFNVPLQKVFSLASTLFTIVENILK